MTTNFTSPVQRSSSWRAVGAVVVAMLATMGPAVSSAHAASLPDNRRYELVTRYEEHGREVGLNGVETGFGIPSAGGDALDWEGLGGCCGATSGALNLYQSYRGEGGWQTRSLTPTPSEGLDGLFEEQAPMFFTADLERTIWATPASYAPGDRRPKYSEKYDLYLQEPTGALQWLSQGPAGTGSGLYSAEFGAASPDAGEVVFSSAEQLTPDATGYESLNPPLQYLYIRDLAHGTTRLVNVNDNDELISRYGAVAGNGSFQNEGLIPPNYAGTTTNTVSADGKKVFFEAPAPGVFGIPQGQATHLYMRNLADRTTIPLDDPMSASPAQYEGASLDGSLVFFTSSEGLDGAPATKQLYEFNTTASAVGSVPAMSVAPVSAAPGGILGVSAVSNDGSHVYFVAEEALASNTNPVGRTAVSGQPNLYAFDTGSSVTTFVTTLGPPDVTSCESPCAGAAPGGLVAEPDIARPVYPTPDGQVLVFGSTSAVTDEDTAPTTKLTATVEVGARTLMVESTAGFMPNRTIAIGNGATEELATIEAVDSPTELTLSEFRPSLVEAHAAGATVTEIYAQFYRYSMSEDSLVCVTCTPAGSLPTGSANLGASGGGSYAPPGQTVPLNEDGSEIFFASPDALVPEAQTVPSSTAREPTNVYEWSMGKISLISNGSSANSALDGTTPSGKDVFFATRTQLVPGNDNGYQEIYDARVGGGFATSAEPLSCEAADCRTPANPDVTFSSLPGSAITGGVSASDLPGLASPTYAIAAITPAQRRLLARTGRLRLTVTATGGGDLTASAFAKIRGRSRRVARAAAKLSGAGRVVLTLRLNHAARTQLAANKSLRLHLEITDSASSTVKLAELLLRAWTPSVSGMRHGRHA